MKAVAIKKGQGREKAAGFQEMGTLFYNVSDRLDSLAGQHPLVSEAFISISGSVRNAATLLGVLVATKIAPLSGLDPASA
jgi:hypothetical protein